MLSLQTLTKISNYFIGDTGELYCYKKGSELVSFFNKYFDYNDYYTSGFDSRWYYTRNKLDDLQKKGFLDSFFNIILDPEFIKNDSWSLKSFEIDGHILKIINTFNDICSKDGATIKKKQGHYVVTAFVDRCEFNIFEFSPKKITKDIYDDEGAIWSIVSADKDGQSYMAINRVYQKDNMEYTEYLIFPHEKYKILYDMLDGGIDQILRPDTNFKKFQCSFDEKKNFLYCDTSGDSVIIERDNAVCYDCIKIPMFIAQHLADELRLFQGIGIFYKDKKTIIPSKTVFIKCNNRYCNKNHSITDISATIEAIKYGRETSISVPVAYCSTCNQYFILDRTLKNISKSVNLLCRIIDYDEYNNIQRSSGSKAFQDLPKESVLRQCGYCVNKNENLSDAQREHILRYVIKSGTLTKDAILGHLSWLIEKNEWKTNFENAVSKWKYDYDFVSNLDIENLPKINIIEIKRK